MEAFNKVPINQVHDPSISKSSISAGWNDLVSLIFTSKKKSNTPFHLIMDGMHGAHYEVIVDKLEAACQQAHIPFSANYTGEYVRSEQDLQTQFAPYLTDNRAFGYVADDVTPAHYFRSEARNEYKQQVQSSSLVGGIQLLYGPGAQWLYDHKSDLTFYVDYSRENQQLRHKAGMGNFGFTSTGDSVESYKHAYFLEWPVWESYRRDWLKQAEHDIEQHAYYMDFNQPEAPVWVSMKGLNTLLQAVAKQPFRVKPFFAPGIWGGQYLKKLCDLPEEWSNCAWSFEPIAPENTMLIQSGEHVIEVPFPLLLEAAPQTIMGVRNVALFGDYFPIRFDYLDTINGGKLSLQVHPQQQYAEDQFNQHMTQQESYYIMEQKPDTKVYLGLKDGVTGEQLLEAVDAAHASGNPLEVNEYVNEWTAKKGDLFLIPPGTVHCSGTDNLVLEISSTTWWFTFKIYDYLRLDADGKPRPINRDHAACNINDEMNTTAAKQGLIAKPLISRTQGANIEELLGQRDDLLFQVRRLHLVDRWEDDTEGSFVMYNLVEGQRVRLIPEDHEAAAVEWGYAEAYIIPASVGRYRIEHIGTEPCTLIRAEVSPNWNIPLLPHHWRQEGVVHDA